MAVGDLTSTAAVKAYLGITETAADGLIAKLVAAVSHAVATYCDRSFASSSCTYVTSGKGGTSLVLPESPVTAVTSLTIDGATVGARTFVGGAGYVLMSPVLMLDGGLRFTRGIANVSVAYTAGYSEIPADLDFAVVETVASWFKRRMRVDEQSKSIGAAGETVSFAMGEMPQAARFIVDQYRRTWPR